MDFQRNGCYHPGFNFFIISFLLLIFCRLIWKRARLLGIWWNLGNAPTFRSILSFRLRKREEITSTYIQFFYYHWLILTRWRLLRLHHKASPHPVCFYFPSASIREQFVQILYHSHPELNPISHIPRNPDNPILGLKIFIGTWNMCTYYLLLSIWRNIIYAQFFLLVSTEPTPLDLQNWIPKGRDLYAIGTQVWEYTK